MTVMVLYVIPVVVILVEEIAKVVHVLVDALLMGVIHHVIIGV